MVIVGEYQKDLTLKVVGLCSRNCVGTMLNEVVQDRTHLLLDKHDVNRLLVAFADKPKFLIDRVLIINNVSSL